MTVMPSAGNPWGVRFARLFDMANDSARFRTLKQLRAAGARREGVMWYLDGERYVPLYEAKLVHQYDHRWAEYEDDGKTTRDLSDADKQDPNRCVQPRYWVPEDEVESRLQARGWARGWLLGWRDICRSTDERTVIAGVVPRVGVGHTFPLMFVDKTDIRLWAALLGNLNVLVYDYVARQKVGGTHLTYGYLKQFPTLSPDIYTPTDLDFIVPRVLELTYTAWDLKPWAEDLGYSGDPFPWNPDSRAQLRAELDAYYAKLYGLTEEELRYILDPADVEGPDYPSETFRALKQKEIRAFGEYRTRRLVLEAWRRLS